MRKLLSSTLTLLLIIACNSASAISLSDLINSGTVESVVSAITGGTTVSSSSLAGTWNYDSSAVKLESDSTLTEAAGSLVTSQIESKLDSIFAKVGITSSVFSFTFGSDNSFSCTCRNKSLGGTYVVDSDSKITLTFRAVGTVNIGSVSAYTSLSISSLSLLFDADKLLTIISAVTSATDNSTLSSIDSLLSNYDGVMIGFDLKK